MPRHAPRTEQARLARHLFRQLGVRGLNVTAPRYSMARAVDVRLPADSLAPLPRTEMEDRVEFILDASFPNHDDRSDTMTDYYDFCWSIE
jgi:hypothetical protein